MKVAIIDMGTNTFHLLIAEVKGDGYVLMHRERRAVKIGEKGINKGEITDEAWERALTTLKDFKQLIDDHQIEQVFSTATSAVRNASNGKALVDEIKKQTGISVSIISGSREAELILMGVRSALELGSEKSLIMDIGGGSIEFIIADKDQTYSIQSFEIGGQRLVEKFHKNDPITESEIEALYHYFDKELIELRNAFEKFLPTTLIGCSGTFDTLSDIFTEENGITRDDSATEFPLTLDGFSKIYEQLIQMDRKERLAIPGMIEMRVDMIVVACVLVNYLVEHFNLKDIRVSAYALKEGVLIDTLSRVRQTF